MCVGLSNAIDPPQLRIRWSDLDREIADDRSSSIWLICVFSADVNCSVLVGDDVIESAGPA